MTDLYQSYCDLAGKESEGITYRIRTCFVQEARFLIVTPHGGDIEPGTSDVVESLARVSNNSFYAFEGLQSRSFHHLHITSHRFDEPRCLEMAALHDTVLAIHGCAEIRSVAYIGGLDSGLKSRLAEAFRNAGICVEAEGHRFMARDQNNICNRGKTSAGAQVEISQGLFHERPVLELVRIMNVALG